MDEKKIEEAARKRLYAFRKANHDGYSSSIIDIESDCLDNFKAGAHWAIKEFLKGLWHPAEEEPDKGKALIIRFDAGYAYFEFKVSIAWRNEPWKHAISRCRINQWAYLSDILPKQEGGDE